MVLVSEFLNIYLLAKKVGSVGFERFLRVWSLVSSFVEFGALRVYSLDSSCVELLMHVVAHGFWPNGVAVAKVGGNRQRAMVFACPL